MTLNVQNTEQDLFISEISILNLTVITIHVGINIWIHILYLNRRLVQENIYAKIVQWTIKRSRACCNDHFKLGFN